MSAEDAPKAGDPPISVPPGAPSDGADPAAAESAERDEPRTDEYGKALGSVKPADRLTP